MKARIYPSKSYVKGILQEELDSKQKLLDDENTKHQRLATSGLYTGDSGILLVDRYEKDVKAIKRKIELLDAHCSPEVAVEIEI